MQWLFAQLMTLFAALNDGPAVPQYDAKSWSLKQSWQQTQRGFTLSASTHTLLNQCRTTPRSFIEFPNVFYASHKIFLDDKLYRTFSDPSFSSLRSVYASPFLNCRDVLEARSMTWTVTSSSDYFARFNFFPRVQDHIPKSLFFSETLNIFAAGSLFALAILSLIIFINKVPHSLTFSFFFACVFFSGYFAGVVPFAFLIDTSVVNVNKIGDASLWLGQVFLFYMLMVEKVMPRRLFFAVFPIMAAAIALIPFAQSVDQVQVATNICILVMYPSLMFMLIRHAFTFHTKQDRTVALLQLFALAVNVLAGVNDMAVVQGIYDGYMVYSLGAISGLMLLGLSVHGHIVETYSERDYLRLNLEKEVEQKTASLQAKTEEVETAMEQLKLTQAELVQSAKLASIGTLAAGIAHEINNSLNYVNGAMRPLEKQIFKSEKINPDKAKQLIDIMKEGLDLTFKIINSLKNHAGMNKSEGNIRVKDVFDSVMPILRSKLAKNHEITFKGDDHIAVDGQMVGLTQVFMNLISNSIDAMPEGGKISVTTEQRGSQVELKFKDNGPGIPTETMARVFEPFFSTKDVGKGTGLGLHIVKSEIEKQNGNIEVHSRPGKGAEFRITLPAGQSLAESAA